MKTKDWNKFRETGLFVFMNCFLHIFGWAIVLELDKNGKIVSAYPKEVNYSGFEQTTMDSAYDRIKKYIKGIEEEEVIEDPKDIKKEMLEDKLLNENDWSDIKDKLDKLRREKDNELRNADKINS